MFNLKSPERAGVKRSYTNTTNITEAPTCLNTFRPSENGKIDSKVTESMQIEHNNVFGSI